MISSRPCMGSRLEITLYHAEPRRCGAALEAAFSEVGRLERLLSRFLPDSELSRVNRLAASGPVVTDPELIGLIRRSLAFSRLTDGAFDVTAQSGRRIGYHQVLIDQVGSTVAYNAPDVQIDLGAIGKGYAIDRAVDMLKRHNIASALVSFGSTTYGLGSPPGQAGWRVAIRHPRDREQSIGIVTLKDLALSTSGDYEQGRHIVDPRSGDPVAGTVSASVIAPTALASDALSTAAFVLESVAGVEMLERQISMEGLIISEDDNGVLTAVQTGQLNYDQRERGTSVESDCRAALQVIEQQEGKLRRLAMLKPNFPLQLTVLISPSLPPVTVPTSLCRELAFVLSHTVHHSALVAVMVKLLGEAVPDRFGYAPATISHLERQACVR